MSPRLNRALAAALAALVMLAVPARAAEPRAANPSTLEFVVDSNPGPDVKGYVVELFPAGSDMKSAAPIKFVQLKTSALTTGGVIRVDLRKSLEDLADGEYVATIRTMAPKGASIRSEPTPPFLVHGTLVTNDERRKERFWTRVGIAIGAAVIIIPLIL